MLEPTTKNFCFECGRPAALKHHVIPKSLGGKKTIPLCQRCHDLAHCDDSAFSMNRLQRGSRKAYKVDLEMCHEIMKLKGTMSSRKAAKKIGGITHDTVARIWRGEGAAIRHYEYVKSIVTS